MPRHAMITMLPRASVVYAFSLLLRYFHAAATPFAAGAVAAYVADCRCFTPLILRAMPL